MLLPVVLLDACSAEISMVKCRHIMTTGHTALAILLPTNPVHQLCSLRLHFNQLLILVDACHPSNAVDSCCACTLCPLFDWMNGCLWAQAGKQLDTVVSDPLSGSHNTPAFWDNPGGDISVKASEPSCGTSGNIQASLHHRPQTACSVEVACVSNWLFIPVDACH